MNIRFLTVAAVSFAALVVRGGGEGLEKSSPRGPWSFSAGPAWRSSMDVDFSGTRQVNFTGTGTGYENGHVGADDGSGRTSDWSGPTATLPDPTAPGYNMAGLQLIGTQNANGILNGNGSDDDSGMGVNLSAGYEFYEAGNFRFGLNLRLAGYWGMKAAVSSNNGVVEQVRFRDTYLFPNWVDGDATPTPGTDLVSTTPMGGAYARTVIGGGQTAPTAFSGRLRSDLYQIGLGPKVTWSPFVGWCEWMEWLDVYGGVEILCNLAHSEFDADGSSSSQTDCLLGFGGNVGLVGNITENIGIYGQVGYEWVDKSDVSTGGFKADIDYSSLVLSAGVQVRF